MSGWTRVHERWEELRRWANIRAQGVLTPIAHKRNPVTPPEAPIIINRARSRLEEVTKRAKSNRGVKLLSLPQFRFVTRAPKLKEVGGGVCQGCCAEEYELFKWKGIEYCDHCLSRRLEDGLWEESDEED